jgi:hypothetical protein
MMAAEEKIEMKKKILRNHEHGRMQQARSLLTSADVVPVWVIRSQFLVDTSLDKVNPLWNNELVVVLEDIGIGSDEAGTRNVTDGDTLSLVF